MLVQNQMIMLHNFVCGFSLIVGAYKLDTQLFKTLCEFDFIPIFAPLAQLKPSLFVPLPSLMGKI